MSDRVSVRGILSSSQVEPPQLVPPTALGNVHTSDGFCSSHRNMGRQYRARVRGISLAYLTSRLLLCINSPISLGVFAASFAVVFIGLFATSAQPTILRLALQLYSVSPLVRWRFTRGWQGSLVSWYKARRAARVCVWIKNDDVRLSLSKCLHLFYHSTFNLDPCHASRITLRAAECAGCTYCRIRPCLRNHRCDTERAPSERASPR